MPSKGDLCSCPLFPCWEDVLFMQQMLLHTWYLAQEVRFISKKKLNKQSILGLIDNAYLKVHFLFKDVAF